MAGISYIAWGTTATFVVANGTGNIVVVIVGDTTVAIGAVSKGVVVAGFVASIVDWGSQSQTGGYSISLIASCSGSNSDLQSRSRSRFG